MTKSCLLCGVGGQGTVLASKLIAAAAMSKGLFARTAETIGMAQRGGSVVSHVRIGDEIHSPLIPIGSADIIIGFEPGEAVRCLPYLKKDGVMVVAKKAVQPVTASLSGGNYSGDEMLTYLNENVNRLIVVDSEKACSDLGSTKVMNIVLLGAAISADILGISADEMENAIKARLNAKFHEMNIKALGYYSSI